VRRIVGAYGAGRIVNPKTARSQCIGGMIGGIDEFYPYRPHSIRTIMGRWTMTIYSQSRFANIPRTSFVLGGKIFESGNAFHESVIYFATRVEAETDGRKAMRLLVTLGRSHK
jgi:hypothetical protein